MIQRAPCSLSLSLLLSLVAVTLEKEPLYLLSLLPYPSDVPSLQPSWDRAPSIIPAAYLALDHINNHSDVLPNYELKLVNGDGGCDITNKAVVDFAKYAVHGVKSRPVVGIIGGGCSASTLALSPLLTIGKGALSLVNIHLAASPLLSEPENRDRYGNSLGIVGSSYGYVEAIAALMRETGWRRVAVLYEEERVFFRSTYRVLQENLTYYVPDSEIVFAALVSSEFEVPLSQIRDELVRVILVLTSSGLAQTIMCLASHMKLHYPAYQWVLVNRDPSVFGSRDVTVEVSGRKHTCHASSLPSALDRSIFLNYRLSALENRTAKSGITYTMFQKMYNYSLEQYNNESTRAYSLPGAERNASSSKFATLIYDATWAFALALDKLDRSGVNLSLYTTGQPNTTQLLKKALYSEPFPGVSGLVKFDPATGFAERTFVVTQVFNEVEQPVGYTNSAMFTAAGETLDSIPDKFEIRLNTVHPAVAAIFVLLMLTLMVLVVITHIITLLNRKYHSIKASSLRLNQVIYLGAYISGIGSLLYILSRAISVNDRAYGIMCQAVWAWFLTTGFTLMIGAICARTWRLYRIFTHYLDPGSFISDPVLLTAVAILASVDIVLGTVWTIVDPLTSQIINEKISGQGAAQILETERICHCKYFFYWIGVSRGYHILLLLLTVVLSLLTRTIKKGSFNTKSLRVLVYLLAILLFGGYTIYFIFVSQSTNIYADYLLLCCLLNITLLLVLCLVFCPPVLPLLREWIPENKLLHRAMLQRHKQWIQNTTTS